MPSPSNLIEPFGPERLAECRDESCRDATAGLSMSSIMSLLNAQRPQTLDAVWKLQSTSSSATAPSVVEDPKLMNVLSLTADDIKRIASEALRISKERQAAYTETAYAPSVSSSESLSPRSEPPPSPAGADPPSLAPPQSALRLNKFVRLLHGMLVAEASSGVVEWRRGLLVLHDTEAFARRLLPRYFNTRNFKTFRRQLNYYGFVHVRSFSTGSGGGGSGAGGGSTTALWVNRALAQECGPEGAGGGNSHDDDVGAVLRLRRVEPTEAVRTPESRRARKELAIHTVEEDIGLTAQSLQLDQIRTLALRGADVADAGASVPDAGPGDWPARSGLTTADDNASAANLLLLLSRT